MAISKVIVRGRVGQYVAKPRNVVVDIDGVRVEQEFVYVFGLAYENGPHNFRGDWRMLVVKAVLGDVDAVCARRSVQNRGEGRLVFGI